MWKTKQTTKSLNLEPLKFSITQNQFFFKVKYLIVWNFEDKHFFSAQKMKKKFRKLKLIPEFQFMSLWVLSIISKCIGDGL